MIHYSTHQSGGCQQYDDSGTVVQAEDVVVDAGRVPLVEQSRDSSKHQSEHGEVSAMIYLMCIESLSH